MKLFVTVYNEARLLPRFLEHYSERGVSEFFIATPPELHDEVALAARGHAVSLVSGLDVADSVSGTAAVSAMRVRHQQPDEWVVIVDLDEFIECPSLPGVAAAAQGAGANLVRGIMHDRFTQEGQPRDARPDETLEDAYPITSRFIREVMGGYDHKGVLVRGLLRPGPGAAHHWFEGERAFAEVLTISHFKWTASSLERVRSSLAILTDAGVAWADEYGRVLDHYAQHGRFAWETFGGRPAAEFVAEPPAGHCAECGGAIAEAEIEYSTGRYGRALCRADQQREPG